MNRDILRNSVWSWMHLVRESNYDVHLIGCGAYVSILLLCFYHQRLVEFYGTELSPRRRWHERHGKMMLTVMPIHSSSNGCKVRVKVSGCLIPDSVFIGGTTEWVGMLLNDQCALFNTMLATLVHLCWRYAAQFVIKGIIHGPVLLQALRTVGRILLVSFSSTALNSKRTKMKKPIFNCKVTQSCWLLICQMIVQTSRACYQRPWTTLHMQVWVINTKWSSTILFLHNFRYICSFSIVLITRPLQ